MMFHAHIILIATCFIHTLYHFYAFYVTNLLIRCHSANCLFSAIFGFIKVIKEIFSKLDETKSHVPIFPDTTQSPMESRRRATEPPHHVVAQAHSLARHHVMCGPRASIDVALSPINTSSWENPRHRIKNPLSSTLDREGFGALFDTLPEGRSSPEALHHHACLRSDA